MSKASYGPARKFDHVQIECMLRGMKPRDVAKALGCSFSRVYSIAGSTGRKKRAPPSLDRVRMLLSYDAQTGVLSYRMGEKAGQEAGSVTSDGYQRVSIDGTSQFAHMVIWLLATGEWPERPIDHENTDRSDNRWGNLRLSSHSLNGANRGPSHHNKSGFKGVMRTSSGKHWRAKIMKDGVSYNLGRFDTPEQAHNAYLVKANDLYGAFARSA